MATSESVQGNILSRHCLFLLSNFRYFSIQFSCNTKSFIIRQVAVFTLKTTRSMSPTGSTLSSKYNNIHNADLEALKELSTNQWVMHDGLTLSLMQLTPGWTLNSFYKQHHLSLWVFCLSGVIISPFVDLCVSPLLCALTKTPGRSECSRSALYSCIVKCICGLKRYKRTERYKIMKTQWILLTDGCNHLGTMKNGSRCKTEPVW